jgi:hypothetical protein
MLVRPHLVEDDTKFLSLLARRVELSTRKLDGDLSAAESRELLLARWAIDQVELARAAEDLNRLRRVAELQEQLAAQVHRFVTAVQGAPKRRR